MNSQRVLNKDLQSLASSRSQSHYKQTSPDSQQRIKKFENDQINREAKRLIRKKNNSPFAEGILKTPIDWKNVSQRNQKKVTLFSTEKMTNSTSKDNENYDTTMTSVKNLRSNMSDKNLSLIHSHNNQSSLHSA